MGNIEKKFTDTIADNIRKIIYDKGITQAAAAEYMGTSPSQFSRMLRGDVSISLAQLSNFATGVSMREIDIITYPEKYERLKKEELNGTEPVEAILQIRLQSDKKDQVLKLIFGENNIEILNK